MAYASDAIPAARQRLVLYQVRQLMEPPKDTARITYLCVKEEEEDDIYEIIKSYAQGPGIEGELQYTEVAADCSANVKTEHYNQFEDKVKNVCQELRIDYRTVDTGYGTLETGYGSPPPEDHLSDGSRPTGRRTNAPVQNLPVSSQAFCQKTAEFKEYLGKTHRDAHHRNRIRAAKDLLDALCTFDYELRLRCYAEVMRCLEGETLRECVVLLEQIIHELRPDSEHRQHPAHYYVLEDIANELKVCVSKLEDARAMEVFTVDDCRRHRLHDLATSDIS